MTKKPENSHDNHQFKYFCWTPSSTAGLIYEECKFAETRKPQRRTKKPRVTSRRIMYINYTESLYLELVLIQNYKMLQRRPSHRSHLATRPELLPGRLK